MASGFSSSNQIMGVRKTTDFLEKATWWLAGGIMALCVISTIFLDSANPAENVDVVSKVAPPKQEAPALPQFGGEATTVEQAPAETPAPAEAQN